MTLSQRLQAGLTWARRWRSGMGLLAWMDAVGGDFYLGDAAEGEEEFYEIGGRLLGDLFDDVGYGVGDGGLEGDSAGAEACEIYADELAWFEHGGHLYGRAISIARTRENIRAMSGGMQERFRRRTTKAGNLPRSHRAHREREGEEGHDYRRDGEEETHRGR